MTIAENKEFPELLTPRLRLRALTEQDASDIQRLAGDKRVATMTENIPYPYEDGVAEDWISSHALAWQLEDAVTFGVFSKDTDALFGCVGLIMTMKHGRASLGYWVGVDFWNQGICTEAAARVVRFGFEKLNLQRIEAAHLCRNPASGSVMRKIGMRHEGRLRHYVRKQGGYEDVELYSIIRDQV